jgi:hypothetical protein
MYFARRKSPFTKISARFLFRAALGAAVVSSSQWLVTQSGGGWGVHRAGCVGKIDAQDMYMHSRGDTGQGQRRSAHMTPCDQHRAHEDGSVRTERVEVRST